MLNDKLMETKNSTIESINHLGKTKTPFIFLTDFLMENIQVIPLDKLNPKEYLFDFNGITNCKEIFVTKVEKSVIRNFTPISFAEYQRQFSAVHCEISYGNTYLINLTVETPIETDFGLKEIFLLSKAPYRLWMKDHFVCFSPETFIQIRDQKIYSFPMKGTIDDNIPNAASVILNDGKELSEHYTIVDLIRNDLNLVAKNVTVEQFRYIQSIKRQKGALLQVSSVVSGKLETHWNERLGDIICQLLPAGSISGAPKKKTVEIIQNIETHPRGFYTGVAGIYDGNSLDSCVLIRYIEERNRKYFYKSGGGITAQSEVQKEYDEIFQKIYVPI